MKKFAAVILFAVAAAAKAADANCPAYPDQHLPCVTVFDGATASAVIGPVSLAGFSKVSVRMSSVAGSVCTITMQRRNTPQESWSDPVVTWANPTQTELGYDMIGAGDVQFTLAYTSGTIIGTVVRVK